MLGRLAGMADVLVVGIDPGAVPGASEESAAEVRAGLERELDRFAAAGISAAQVLVPFDGTAEAAIAAALAERAWDVVVVGGGIRKPEALLPLFEETVNLIRRHAPRAALAFNTSGGDSVEAAQRRL